MTGSTWRKHPLVIGGHYRARKSFRSFASGALFVSGTVYEFLHVGYSHYDSSTVFTFKAENDAAPMYWWWEDDQPDTQFEEYFEITGGFQK